MKYFPMIGYTMHSINVAKVLEILYVGVKKVRFLTHIVEKAIKNRNRVDDSGILIARCYLKLSILRDNEKNLTPGLRDLRPR